MSTATAPTRKFLSLATAAERWDVSADSIRRLIYSGKLPAYRLNGRVLRVAVEDLDACFRPVHREVA